MKKTNFFYLCCLFWIISIFGIVGTLASRHYISFNPSQIMNVEAKKFFDHQKNETTAKWTLHHILGVGCGCSDNVFKYLVARGPESNFNEFVTIIGQSEVWKKSLIESGFVVTEIDEKDLNGDDLLGVPYLSIYNDSKKSIYQGGYGAHFIRKSEDILDLKIARSLQGQGQASKTFPIYGCATSSKYKKRLDPFELKTKKVEI